MNDGPPIECYEQPPTDLQIFVKLVQEMRDAQHKHWLTKSINARKKAFESEKRVDAYLEEYFAEKDPETLF